MSEAHKNGTCCAVLGLKRRGANPSAFYKDKSISEPEKGDEGVDRNPEEP